MEAEIKFKSVSKAYEILYDDDKRHLYDTHGMSAFDSAHGNGMGAGPDLEEMLSQMFGMGGFGGPGPPRRSRRGDDEEHPYQVTLEDLYKGKSTKFASTKNVICSHCKGSGAKEKAKAKQCASCQGKGTFNVRGVLRMAPLMRDYRLQARTTVFRTRFSYPRNSHMRFM